MKVKSKIDYEKHKLFHDEISKMISEHLPPTTVVERVKEYITAMEIPEEEAISMLLLSSVLAVNFTLMLIYTDLSELPNTPHFHPHDAMISQLACIMWTYAFKKMKFNKEISTHEDAQFIEFLDKNFPTVTQIVAKWIGLWLMFNTNEMITMGDVNTAAQISFKEVDCSIELLILSYYFFLHDLVAVKSVVLGMAQVSESIEEKKSEIIDKEKPKIKKVDFKGEKVEIEYMDYNGKIIKFPNRTKH